MAAEATIFFGEGPSCSCGVIVASEALRFLVDGGIVAI